MRSTDNDLRPEVSVSNEKQLDGEVSQVEAASVALAAAVREQKTDLWSPSMRKLYAIMAVGYRYVCAHLPLAGRLAADLTSRTYTVCS